MEALQDKIVRKQKELETLKIQAKQVFDSVKAERDKGYYDGFTDTCQQVLCLIEGAEYKPYSDRNKLSRGSQRKSTPTVYFDYCAIYGHEFGSPIGFIALESGLYEATSGDHTNMWITAIKRGKETRGFAEFCDNLKSDVEFLKKFHNRMVEDSTDYESVPQLVEYQNRALKIKKHYIFYNKTR